MMCASQFAAHQLDKDAKQWEDNAMVLAARKMAKLMMQMAKFARSAINNLSYNVQMQLSYWMSKGKPT